MQIKTIGVDRLGWRAIFCLWVLGFVVLNPVYPRSGSNIRFELISLEQGLSQASINCILQDKQGFVWFGTQDGLNKYDGYTFTVYRHDPDNKASLSDNFIRSICEDTDGNLWIGTQSGGVDNFDRKTETFRHYQHQADNPQSLSDNTVQSIYEDTSGNLWIGTKEGGLNKLGHKMETFTHYQHEPDNPQSLSNNDVWPILEDAVGILWIGTLGGGLNKFDRKTETFTHYQHQADNPKSLSDNSVQSIYKDSEGNMWIGTLGDGLNKFDRKTETFTHYQHQADNPQSLSHNSVWTILEDADGILWIGTEGGLNKFDRQTGTFTPYQHQADNRKSLSHNYVYSLYKDTGGNLWVGTQGGGINRIDQKAKAFTHYRNQADNPKSLSSNMVFSILEDAGGILWIGTEGGLNKFDRKTETFTPYQHQANNPKSLSNNIVMKIFEDTGGDLWIGTYRGGLNKFDRKTETFTNYQYQADNPNSLSSNEIRSIFEDTGGNLWIGTYNGGLNKFDRKTETFTHYRHQDDNPKSLSDNNVYSIFEDTGGNLWVGTQSGGLNKFDRKAETFTHYRHQADDPKSLSHDYVMSIFEDKGSDLWIGTAGGGLNKFDRKAQNFTCYREKDGLANDVVYGIVQDDNGNFWLSTNNGISKFNPKTKTFINYDERDGLQSNEFNVGAYYKNRAGRVYFGGPNGFNVFHPDDIKDDKNIPPVVITDFLLFNKSIEVANPKVKADKFQLQKQINFTKEITLNYTDYIFAFEFSALNYSQSKKNQFAYKLEGFDKNWIETNYQHRRATYTDLPDGKYVFRVKASNEDGYWNEIGTSVKMTILPPPWKTWWAYTLYTVAVLSLLLWFVKSQRRKVQQKQQELEREKNESARLEKIVAERTQQLREASLTDPLTGLRNRRFIQEVLQNDIAAFIGFKNYVLTAKNQRRTMGDDAVFGLFLLDIDFFKKVNDAYGHDAGDRLLKQFAAILTASVRLDDVVIRVGGEEFLVLLKKTRPEYLSVFAAKTLEKVAATPFDLGDGTTIRKTCSIGYTRFPLYQEKPNLLTFEQSIMVADRGLLHAKNHGRNQGVCLEAGPNTPSGKEILQKTVTSLDFALKEGYLQFGDFPKNPSKVI